MSDLFDVERFTLADVADRLGVHSSTVWRWAINGVRGKRLRTHLVGGRRYVARSDIDKFLSDHSAQECGQCGGKGVAAEVATKRLDAMGVKR